MLVATYDGRHRKQSGHRIRQGIHSQTGPGGEQPCEPDGAIRFYARSKGIRIRSKDIEIDDGTSAGIPIWERKGGKLLLKKCESGDFGHLIITKMDRMFRITSDAIHTIDELNDMDIGFHVIDMGGQSLDTTSAMGRFILRSVASSAELERGMTSERTREAMQYLRRKRLRFTRSIYGWEVTKSGKLRPNWREEQARLHGVAGEQERNDGLQRG